MTDQEFAERLSAGQTFRQISRAVGINDRRLGHMAKRLGLKSPAKTGTCPKIVAKIKKLWFGGESAAKIGAQVGLSKNAVVGIAGRRGWKRDPIIGILNTKRYHPGAGNLRKPKAPAVKKDTATVNRVNLKRSGAGGWGQLDFRSRAPLKPSWPEAPTGIALNPRPWITRDPLHECNFPVGGEGADTLYCCNKTEPGHHYCKGHEVVAFIESKHDDKSLYRSLRKFV